MFDHGPGSQIIGMSQFCFTSFQLLTNIYVYTKQHSIDNFGCNKITNLLKRLDNNVAVIFHFPTPTPFELDGISSNLCLTMNWLDAC